MKVENLKGVVHSDPEIMGGTPVFISSHIQDAELDVTTDYPDYTDRSLLIH